jgi:pyrroloquinoline quinone (PQQ) biosynthesis protein C
MQISEEDPRRGAVSDTIEVYTDGCGLCAEALRRIESAAAGGRLAVAERRIADMPAATLEARGIRATPAIVAHGLVAAVGCPTPERARSLVKRAHLDRVVLEYAIPRSDAMQRFARAETRSDITARTLATEFYAFSHEFPLFLAAAISHVRDEASRLLLVHNLYEEHGNLELDRVHPKLFRQFVVGLGLEPAALERYDQRTAGVQAAEWVTQICRAGPAHRALGALYVTEMLFGPTCEIIMQGLRHLDLSAEATEFFSLHSVAEEHHKEQLWLSLEKICTTDALFDEAVGVASDISRMFYSLFDYIARADVLTTAEELAVYEAVRRVCADTPAAARHPIGYTDSTYYFGIHAGAATNWFLRAFCDCERRSLVTRLPLARARELAGRFAVEAAPEVFGTSRIHFGSPGDVEALRGLVVAAYEDEVRHIEAGGPALPRVGR